MGVLICRFQAILAARTGRFRTLSRVFRARLVDEIISVVTSWGMSGVGTALRCPTCSATRPPPLATTGGPNPGNGNGPPGLVANSLARWSFAYRKQQDQSSEHGALRHMPVDLGHRDRQANTSFVATKGLQELTAGVCESQRVESSCAPTDFGAERLTEGAWSRL